MNTGGRWDRSLPYWLQDIMQGNNIFLHTHTYFCKRWLVTLKKKTKKKQQPTNQSYVSGLQTSGCYLQYQHSVTELLAEGDAKTSIWSAEIVVVFQPASSLLPFLIFIFSSLIWISKLLKVTLLLYSSACLTYVECIPPRKSQILTAPTVPQGSPADHSSLQSHSFPYRWPEKRRNTSLFPRNS